jgi:glycosyltransferase involved in cell wall biosynthesis
MNPRRLLKAWALRSACRIFSLNKLEIECLTNSSHPGYYGLSFDRSKCVYLPNIVDRELFYPLDKAQARRMTGCDPSIPCLLYVGFLRREKGVQHIIRLLPQFIKKYPTLQLWILGNGDYEPDLRNLVNGLGVKEQVRFVGPVPNQQLRPYYSMADVHLLPSYTESFGTVLIEAMACGTSSIGSRVGGIPEVLSDGAGLLVPPRDEEALFKAVVSVLEGIFQPNPEVRRRKMSEYSYENMGSILAHAYEDVMQNRNSAKAS